MCPKSGRKNCWRGECGPKLAAAKKKRVRVHSVLPYCGLPPLPGELLSRFNLDPILAVTLTGLALAHLSNAHSGRARAYAATGWTIAALALMSPLCAWSVALFSARIGQHMILALVAAPLIASGLKSSHSRRGGGLWAYGLVFFAALWVWHMPAPYDATFASTPLYWLMHVTLFGGAILLWRELLDHSPRRTPEVLAVGLLSSLQMGMLGAILTLATHPLFYPHLLTSYAWRLTPLQDQQLGGALMWVPGMLLFLWAAIRSLRRLWRVFEDTRQHDTARVS